MKRSWDLAAFANALVDARCNFKPTKSWKGGLWPLRRCTVFVKNDFSQAAEIANFKKVVDLLT